MVKNPYASAGNTGNASSIPGSGRSPGKGHGNPLQCSCLEYPMARGAWRGTAHGGPEEPGGVQPMGGQRSLAGYSPWGARGAWWAIVHGGPEEPGGLQSMGGQRSLAGYSPWGHKGQTLLHTHTQQQVMACTKSKNNHERERQRYGNSDWINIFPAF